MRSLTARLARAFIVAVSLLSAAAAAQDAKPTFTDEQLDQMLAPIALYPDSLLSQVLMAATYPADVAEAATWSKAHANQKGDDAVKAVDSQPWDPSVKSLVAFPQVILMMGEKPSWVQEVGDAFLAQPASVMDRAQYLRKKAQESGNLKSTEQQKVIVEQAPPQPEAQPQQQAAAPQTIIKIEPANPQVVYVPTYNPTVVYGTWWWPAYPPVYLPPPPGYVFGTALVSGIAFGIGIGVTNALWGGCNWGRHDVSINVNKYNNVNVNRQINANQTNVNWNHNADNRRGVPYRDQASREQFGKSVPGASERADFRGRDAERQQAQAALQQRGMDPAQERDKLRNDPQTRERAQSAAQRTDRDATRPSGGNAPRDNAFAGAKNPEQARQQQDRGNASRQEMQRTAGGAGTAARGAQTSGGARASGARAGGGGRRR